MLPPALDWRAAPQALSSETGKVIDDFVLKKAANYKPNLTARNNFLGSGFQSTYQGSFLEVCLSGTSQHGSCPGYHLQGRRSTGAATSGPHQEAAGS